MMQRMVTRRAGRQDPVDDTDEASVWTVPAWRRAFPAAAVPTLVVGPLAGVVVDRVNRHTVMILSNLMQVVTIGSLLIVPALGGRLGLTAALLWVYAVVVVSS